MPRFLCLPGYFQSGKVFAEKLSGFRKTLTKKHGYELEYIDAPIRIERKEDLPFLLGVNEKEANEKFEYLAQKGVNRCWFDYHDGIYDRFDESYNYLIQHIRNNGPYDGIVGFSQGAAMAAIIANSIHLHPDIQPFKVAALFSGFAFTVSGSSAKFEDELLAEFSARLWVNEDYRKYYQMLKDSGTSVIVVYGSEDVVVPPLRSQYLASLYENASEFEHDGGHYLPNKKNFLAPIVEKICQAVEPKPAL